LLHVVSKQNVNSVYKDGHWKGTILRLVTSPPGSNGNLNCCSITFLQETNSVCSVNIVKFLLKIFNVKADSYRNNNNNNNNALALQCRC
jgi:hypothetical protein